ncbi:hypothetical protein L195_g007529 [Trifolium pratense]|uniref:RNase H type-1 domain-containing protein n=1 Tax=Trifolium pratense TaxID=57577 RepID=A0A2K3P6L6_TRIPR|nr:hypothetical protein L195_g007529 [Trifolium pratense]
MSPNEISSVTVACGSLLCPICDHDGEDDLYVFFGCIAAQDSWQAACPEMVPHNDEYQPESVADRIFAICNKEDSGTVGRVATLLWCGVFGIIEMNKCGMKTSVTTPTCYFRNHEGRFVAVVTIWQQTLLSTVEGEVVALLCAMEEARARSFVGVQFESDSQLLVDAI